MSISPIPYHDSANNTHLRATLFISTPDHKSANYAQSRPTARLPISDLESTYYTNSGLLTPNTKPPPRAPLMPCPSIQMHHYSRRPLPSPHTQSSYASITGFPPPLAEPWMLIQMVIQSQDTRENPRNSDNASKTAGTTGHFWGECINIHHRAIRRPFKLQR